MTTVEETDVRLPSLPRPLRWLVPAREQAIDVAGNLTIEAAGQTDWFIDPGSGAEYHNAPALLMPAPGPWQFSARVSADHRATFDAAVLFVHVNDEAWAKLCLELSPQAEVTVVSVVTRGASDDCNSAAIAGSNLHLRVSRLTRAYAFHSSGDGRRWSLVRHFSLGPGSDLDIVKVGFLAQSPSGDGCTARFNDVAFRETLLEDIRSGA